MIPNNFFLAGGAANTLMGPAGAALMLIAVALIIALPRKYILTPVLLAALLIPEGEVVVLGGFHLGPVRIIALFGLLRLAWLRYSSRVALFSGGLNSIDKAFLICAIAHSVAFILLWRQIAAVTNQMGLLLGGLGFYVLLRFLIRDEEDVYRVLKVLAIIAAINACGMIYERLRIQNLFGLLIGGVDPVPLIREGKIRSQGAFGHAILAGTFGAMLLPLFVVLWTHARAKVLSAVGVTSSLVMVLTSASSTPVMAILGVVVGIGFWPLRRNMGLVRWLFASTLILLHLVMKAPVWFLIARVDVVGGSASYDRAHLIDVFIKHFFDWWLIGTHDIGSWGWSMWDLSNAYIFQGESGGLIAFIFFIAIISRSFGRLGKARSLAKAPKQEWLMWLFSASLFANVMAFFGVSYWDQTEVAWFAVLAMISAITSAGLRKEKQQIQVQPASELDLAASSLTDWEQVQGEVQSGSKDSWVVRKHLSASAGEN